MSFENSTSYDSLLSELSIHIMTYAWSGQEEVEGAIENMDLQGFQNMTQDLEGAIENMDLQGFQNMTQDLGEEIESETWEVSEELFQFIIGPTSSEKIDMWELAWEKAKLDLMESL